MLTRALAVVVTCCALWAVPAASDTLTTDESRTLPRLIDSACVDLIEQSNGCEQVILLASETEPDSADLIILRDWRTEPASEPLAILRNVAFNGAMWGMAPSLEPMENGSIRLQSEQTGIGRHPWTQTLTLAHRDDTLLIAGFTYSTYDRMAGGGMMCDVNLLTGDYDLHTWGYDPEAQARSAETTERGRMAPHWLPLSGDAARSVFPAPCEAGLAALDGF